MAKTVKELAEFLVSQGMTCAVEGDDSRPIARVNTLEEARDSDVSFLSNPKYDALLATTSAGAVLVRADQNVPDGRTVMRTGDPYEALMRLTVFLHGYRKHPFRGVSSAAHINEQAVIGDDAAIAAGATVERGATIGRNVVLYPGAYVGEGVRMGDDCTLFPNAVVYNDCILGNRVTLHAGTVVGQDGLGYAPVGDAWHKIPQIGIVEVQDDVEIGANCAIDRATLGRTVIGRGTKFSDLVAIGHGTKVGEDCMVVAQVGIAGSSTIGRHVTIAGKAGIAGHLRIGDHARVGAMAGVMRDVADNMSVLGQPAVEIGEARKIMTATMRLPDLARRLRECERALDDLRGQVKPRD
jgi:UDP-3-O-[3-hydroxymyristoyl] glucosamine N-acyltransferase